MDLYLLKDFNNYFNRKVIRLSALQDYLDSVEEDGYFVVENTNFNPNDGISTSHVIGSANHPFDKDWQPDYALLVNWPDGGQPRIVSRWFVTESARTRGNQYTVALKRDSIVDKYDEVKEAPCFIKKATIPENNPLIVNSEGMNLNQKKVAEYLLRDRSKAPWIVCYIAHNAAKDGIQVNTDIPKNIPDLETDTSAEAQILRKMFLQDENFTTDYNHNLLLDNSTQIVLRTGQYYSIWVGYNWYAANLGQRNSSIIGWVNGIGASGGSVDNKLRRLFDVGTDQAGTIHQYVNNLSSDLSNDYSSFWGYIKQKHPDLTKSQRIDGDIPQLQKGKIWRYGQNYYELIEDEYRTETANIYFDTQTNDYLHQKMVNAFSGSGKNIPANTNVLKFRNVGVKHIHYRLQLKTGLTAQLDIKAGRIHPEEVPYDIIAFPYEPLYVKQWGKNVDDVISLAAARSIAVELAQGCYDVQILPYCPVLDEYIDENGQIDLGEAVENINYCVVYKTEGATTTKYTIGFYCHSAYQSLTGNNAITKLFANNQEYNVSDICKISDDGRKVDNECDMWRLCAPNWTSQFEFKLTKTIDLENSTPLDHFDVDITYRPYQPYIRVAPQFGFLYETNYNDARGLICGTGFSITLIDDKWQTYELNNKNYQNMFNREIQGMEVSRAISREQEQWNISQAWTSAVTGMVGGGIAGFLAGEINPLAGIGVGLGAINRTVQAGMKVADAYKQAGWAERAYQENRDFKLDMFNMSLDNIKALPSSITQSSSISYNFKFFPVLEKYTCTDLEREQVKNKIKWNGMTVGLIGRIAEYISDNEERYIQGDIIRLDAISDDSHLANDIYNELNKGLFFEPYVVPNKNKEVK